MAGLPVSDFSTLRGRRLWGLNLGRAGFAVVPALLAFFVVAAFGAAHGAYFPDTWGWLALVLLWTAAIGLAARAAPQLGTLDLALLAGLAGFVGWVALSATWSRDFGQTILEAERDLVYLAGVGAILLVVRRRHVHSLLGGLCAAVTVVSAYALATRLFPDELGTLDPVAVYRLSDPVGYWNALAIFAVIGALLALGFAVGGTSLAGRALAAAALVALLPTIYFTYGRGAILALGVGLVALVAMAPQRLRLVTTLFAVAPAPAIAVWLGSRSHALTRQRTSVAAAAHEGHRLALWIVLLGVLGAVLMVAFALAEKRVKIDPRSRRAYGGILAGLAAATLLAVFVHYGSPPTLVRKGYDAFKAPPVKVHAGTNLNKRLFSFSGNGRAALWSAAWDDYTAHPWLGSGAGSYEQWWLQHRRTNLQVRDAHGLYVEVLAELGPVGLALLVLALGVPLFAAVRARRHPLVPAAFAAYVAFLVHAAADWDWEMTAVTLTALFCGAAIVVAARPEQARVVSGRARAGGIAVAAALAAFSLVGLVGNGALSASADDARPGHWRAAEREALKAIDWAPWSSQAWQQLGEVQLGLNETGAARKSFEKALARNSHDWSIWYDLGVASSGATRRQAYAEAARLNPRSENVDVLRILGVLPKVGR